jgi:hypothetical protein
MGGSEIEDDEGKMKLLIEVPVLLQRESLPNFPILPR